MGRQCTRSRMPVSATYLHNGERLYCRDIDRDTHTICWEIYYVTPVLSCMPVTSSIDNKPKLVDAWKNYSSRYHCFEVISKECCVKLKA